jgi:uncharacterized membrane protein YdjX (TVP38/TMEM64 family)
MKRLLSLFFFIALLIIGSFLLFSDFESRTETWVHSTGSVWAYSLVSFLLLAGDILLPVPSSLLLLLNGKVLGLLPGAFLSLAGGMTCSLIGYYLGHQSTGLVNRFFSKEEIASGNRLFQRYGRFSIALSKSMPVLSETISFLSGCSGTPLKAFLFNSFIGHLFISVTYAILGHFAVAYNSHLLAGIVIGSVLLITWIAGRLARKNPLPNRKPYYPKC